ncbi:MAG TPA: GGDEF domain-containing protein [Candidatus Baltobacteraceae bacterium]
MRTDNDLSSESPAWTISQLRSELEHLRSRLLVVEAERNELLREDASRYATLHELARTDSLTGLLNRRALAELLELECAAAERHATTLAYAIVDVDNLKKINDAGGHELGDQTLCRFAGVLASNARKSDILARYAGDEFVLVMTRTGRLAATKGVERIVGALRDEHLSSSIGLAMFPADGADPRALFAAADRALYAAKNAGKDQYRFYEAAEGVVPTGS